MKLSRLYWHTIGLWRGRTSKIKAETEFPTWDSVILWNAFFFPSAAVNTEQTVWIRKTSTTHCSFTLNFYCLYQKWFPLPLVLAHSCAKINCRSLRGHKAFTDDAAVLWWFRVVLWLPGTSKPQEWLSVATKGVQREERCQISTGIIKFIL